MFILFPHFQFGATIIYFVLFQPFYWNELMNKRPTVKWNSFIQWQYTEKKNENNTIRDITTKLKQNGLKVSRSCQTVINTRILMRLVLHHVRAYRPSPKNPWFMISERLLLSSFVNSRNNLPEKKTEQNFGR